MAAAFVGVVFFAVGQPSLLKIKKVTVVISDARFPDQPVRAFVEKMLLGRSLIFYDGAGLERGLVKKFPVVSSVSYAVKFPAELLVSVTEKQPVAALLSIPSSFDQASESAVLSLAQTVEGSDRQLPLIDRDGFVFAEGSSASLTKVVAPGPAAAVGERLAGDFWKKILTVATECQTVGLETALVSSFEGDIAVVWRDGTLAILAAQKEIPSQVSVLKMILEKYRIEGKHLRKIDLRFKYPVVEFR